MLELKKTCENSRCRVFVVGAVGSGRGVLKQPRTKSWHCREFNEASGRLGWRIKTSRRRARSMRRSESRARPRAKAHRRASKDRRRPVTKFRVLGFILAHSPYLKALHLLLPNHAVMRIESVLQSVLLSIVPDNVPALAWLEQADISNRGTKAKYCCCLANTIWSSISSCVCHWGKLSRPHKASCYWWERTSWWL